MVNCTFFVLGEYTELYQNIDGGYAETMQASPLRLRVARSTRILPGKDLEMTL